MELPKVAEPNGECCISKTEKVAEDTEANIPDPDLHQAMKNPLQT